MADQRVSGRTLCGDEPKRLELSDGSRLILDGAPDQGRSEWRHVGRRHSNVSVAEARSLAGDDYAGYITTRTRAEVEWLRAVGDWYRQQADRLNEQLGKAGA